jgi:hypothetical protein
LIFAPAEIARKFGLTAYNLRKRKMQLEADFLQLVNPARSSPPEIGTRCARIGLKAGYADDQNDQ